MDSRVDSGTSGDYTVAVGAAAASVGSVGRLGGVGCGWWSLDMNSFGFSRIVAVRASPARATLSDGLRIDAAVVADDVFVVAARAESSVDSSECSASLSLPNGRLSFHSKSSIQFLRLSRDYL